MFSTRHITSFLTLTALTCTAAELYCSQAKTKSEVAQVLAKIEVTQVQIKSESVANLQAQAQIQASPKNEVAQTETTKVTQSMNPLDSASSRFLDLMQEYRNFNTHCSELTKNTAQFNFDFTKVKDELTALQKLHKTCKEKQEIIDKNYDYYANVSKNKNAELDAKNNEAEKALYDLREQLVNHLEEMKQNNFDNKDGLQKLLDENCKILEDHLFYDDTSKASNAYQKLQTLKNELKVRIAKLDQLEKATKEELARQNSLWFKLTRGKYVLPMIFALSVAAGCLTYGETKHKFISKLIWGKQPEKVIQLSWWARNWGWFKRLFRLRA